MNRTALALLAATALAACGTTARGAPETIAGADWRVAAQEDSATLSYQTDVNRTLQFECHGGQDPELGVMAWVPNPPNAAATGGGKPEEILLISGGERQIYPTLTEANATGQWELMGHARKNDLVIAAFRETGWLTLMVDGRSMNLIPQHNTSAVADFFEWCH